MVKYIVLFCVACCCLAVLLSVWGKNRGRRQEFRQDQQERRDQKRDERRQIIRDENGDITDRKRRFNWRERRRASAPKPELSHDESLAKMKKELEAKAAKAFEKKWGEVDQKFDAVDKRMDDEKLSREEEYSRLNHRMVEMAEEMQRQREKKHVAEPNPRAKPPRKMSIPLKDLGVEPALDMSPAKLIHYRPQGP